MRVFFKYFIVCGCTVYKRIPKGDFIWWFYDGVKNEDELFTEQTFKVRK
jgi:hypothetical protein